LRSSRRIPLRVAPRPGEGSVAAFSDEGFVMLVVSLTKGCYGYQPGSSRFKRYEAMRLGVDGNSEVIHVDLGRRETHSRDIKLQGGLYFAARVVNAKIEYMNSWNRNTEELNYLFVHVCEINSQMECHRNAVSA
jgi:hypothetical protein